MLPLSWLLRRISSASCGRFPKDGGMEPVNWLSFNDKKSKLERPANEEGRFPLNRFPERSMFTAQLRLPNVDGIVPERLFEGKDKFQTLLFKTWTPSQLAAGVVVAQPSFKVQLIPPLLL